MTWPTGLCELGFYLARPTWFAWSTNCTQSNFSPPNLSISYDPGKSINSFATSSRSLNPGSPAILRSTHVPWVQLAQPSFAPPATDPAKDPATDRSPLASTALAPIGAPRSDRPTRIDSVRAAYLVLPARIPPGPLHCARLARPSIGPLCLHVTLLAPVFAQMLALILACLLAHAWLYTTEPMIDLLTEHTVQSTHELSTADVGAQRKSHLDSTRRPARSPQQCPNTTKPLHLGLLGSAFFVWPSRLPPLWLGHLDSASTPWP